MSLNLFVILAAVAGGAITAVIGVRVLHASRSWIVAMIAAFGASCAMNLVASGIGGSLASHPSMFTPIHVTYLWMTLGLPLAGLLALVFTRDRPLLVTGALGASLLLVPIGLYTTYVEPFWLRIDEVTLPVLGVSEPFTIGVLADLQTTTIGDYEREAVDRLIELEPDIVLMPGDLYQFESPSDFARRLPEFREQLQKLGDRVPLVIMVNGNTDSPLALRQIADGTEVQVLDNETIVADVGGNEVMIGGVTLFGSQAGAQQVANDLVTANDPDTITILLGHKPDEITRLQKQPVSLVVAGHTHGGQISLPFFGPPITLSDVPRDIAAGGLHTLDGTPIYVSTGVGHEQGTAPQIRFGVRPSIGLIEIVPAG